MFIVSSVCFFWGSFCHLIQNVSFYIVYSNSTESQHRWQMASPAGSQYVHKACQQMGAWSGLNILVDSCVDFGYKNSIDQPPPTPADNITLNLKPLGFGASPLLFHTLAAWFLSQAQVKMLLMLPVVQERPDTWIVTVVTTFLKTSVHRCSWCSDSSLSPLLVKLSHTHSHQY